MSSDIAISVKNLTKTYRIFGHPGDRIKQAFTFGQIRFHKEFTALQDVSFEIKRGETVGIVGRNGSGKSTLLQLICGILKPTSGTVQVNGRISALLELGAGFNPEFTGRENVYFQGAIMGVSEEQMDRRFDEIAAFADIGEFMEQQVRTYSSGMFVRLAFSVAISVDPDILVVDEALAVGDSRFQAKCFRKLESFRNEGKTIFFVSHSADQIIRFCDQALMLEQGKLHSYGNAKSVTNDYLNLLFMPSRKEAALENPEPDNVTATRDFFDPRFKSDSFSQKVSYNSNEFRWGNQTAEIIDYQLYNNENHTGPLFSSHNELTLNLKILFHQDVARPIYGVMIKTLDGTNIFGTNSRDWNNARQFAPQCAGDVVFVRFSLKPMLNTGSYLISVGVAEDNGVEVVPLDRRYDSISINFSATPGISGLADMDFRFEKLEIASPGTVVSQNL